MTTRGLWVDGTWMGCPIPLPGRGMQQDADDHKPTNTNKHRHLGAVVTTANARWTPFTPFSEHPHSTSSSASSSSAEKGTATMGLTPLLCVVYGGYSDIASLLITHNADPTIPLPRTHQETNWISWPCLGLPSNSRYKEVGNAT